MIKADVTQRFIESYFSHPIWKEFRDSGIDPWIRLFCLYKRTGEKKEIKKHFYVEESHDFSHALRVIDRFNRAGMNCYYYCNVMPFDCSATDDAVLGTMFIPIDHDHRVIGWKKKLKDLGLSPWAVITTSTVSGGNGEAWKRRQTLFYVSPENRDKERGRELSYQLAEVLGGDDTVCNPGTLLRLPGTRNWGKDGGGKSFADIDYLSSENGRKHKELSEEIVGQIKDLPAAKKAKKGAAPVIRSQYGENGGVGITWKEALNLGKKGKISAPEGRRNTYLTSWAGGLADSIVWAGLSEEKAYQYFDVLVDKACENPKTLSEREVASIRESMHKWIVEGGERKEAERILEAKIRADVIAGVGVLPGGKEEPTRAGVVDLNDLESIHNEVDSFITFLFSDDQGSKDKDDGLQFLYGLFLLLRDAKAKKSLMSRPASFVVRRAIALKLVHQIQICLPVTQKAKWETRVDALLPLNKEQLEGVASGVVDRAFELFEEKAGELTKLLRKKGEEDVESDKEEKEGGKKALKLDMSQTSKWQLRQSVVSGVMNWRVAAIDDHGGRHVINFQNGVLDLDSGDFTKCAAAHQNLHAIFTEFDENLRGEVGSINSDADLAAVLGRRCPLFFQFLSDTFPDDPKTWMIVLLWIGYSFTAGNPFNLALNFHGASNAGKSTLALLIMMLVGERASYEMTYERLTDPIEGLGHCAGKLAVFVDEADSEDLKPNHRNQTATIIKRILSGGKCNVRGIYEKLMSRRISAKFIFAANDPLRFDDEHGAMSNRIVPLMFTRGRGIHSGLKITPELNVEIAKEAANNIATIASLLLTKNWKLGRDMFLVNESKALKKGQHELEKNIAPRRHFLDAIVKYTGNTKDHVSVWLLCAWWTVYAEENVKEIGGEGRTLFNQVVKDLEILGKHPSGKLTRPVAGSKGRQEKTYAIEGLKIHFAKAHKNANFSKVLKQLHALKKTAFDFVLVENPALWVECKIPRTKLERVIDADYKTGMTEVQSGMTEVQSGMTEVPSYQGSFEEKTIASVIKHTRKEYILLT